MLARNKIPISTSVYKYLGIEPHNGVLGDERIKDITIEHLIRHQGGWDKNVTFDPLQMSKMPIVLTELGIDRATQADMVRFMFSKPLQFAPGKQRAYSNFGYLLLGLVVEKASGKAYCENLKKYITKPLRIPDMDRSYKSLDSRNPREVYYPRESGADIDLNLAYGGLVATSESLLRFTTKYTMSGKKLDRKKDK